MANGTDQAGAADRISPEELREYHRKIEHHIKLMQKVATDLDVVDMAYKLGDWVEMAGIEATEGQQKLSWLLDAFEKILARHFGWEEDHLLIRFDERGAVQFSEKLVKEHKEYRELFQALYGKIGAYEQIQLNKKNRARLGAEIKSDLKDLLKKLEVHALEEEDAFFMVDHNI